MSDNFDEKMKPQNNTIAELKSIIMKKLNSIFCRLETFVSRAQKFTMAVSNANITMVNKYCQNDSSRFMLAIVSETNAAVYSGIKTNETNLAATLLNP